MKKFKVLNHVNNNKFDLIVLADVLEHLKNDKIELSKLEKCLKKRGMILITVPANKFLFSKKISFFKINVRLYSFNIKVYK